MTKESAISGRQPQPALSFSALILQKNVSLVNQTSLALSCNSCKRTWMCKLVRGSHLESGYWRALEDATLATWQRDDLALV